MRFEVTTFNLFNLVAPGARYYSEPPYSEAEFATKSKWIADRLQDAAPTIVGFQEVFHETALKQVVGAVDRFSSGTVFAPAGDKDEPAVGLATSLPLVGDPISVSRFPVGLEVRIDGLDDPVQGFRRPPLRAKVQLPDGPQLIVYVAHLKSKRPLIPDDADRDDPLQQARGQFRALAVRSAEATALRALIVADRTDHADTPIVVLGDLNDDVDSVPLEIIGGREPPKYWPRAKRQRAWNNLLYNTATIQARRNIRDVGYSHLGNGRHSMLDHILVSQEFFHRNPKRIGVVENVRYINDHLIDRSQHIGGDRDRSRSDHGLVTASLRLGR